MPSYKPRYISPSEIEAMRATIKEQREEIALLTKLMVQSENIPANVKLATLRQLQEIGTRKNKSRYGRTD